MIDGAIRMVSPSSPYPGTAQRQEAEVSTAGRGRAALSFFLGKLSVRVDLTFEPGECRTAGWLGPGGTVTGIGPTGIRSRLRDEGALC